MGKKLGQSNPLTGGIEDEYEYNKQVANQIEKDALFNAAQRRRAGDRLMKEQAAAYGSAGVEIEGTALDVIKEDLKDAEMEAMNIVYTGKRRKAETMFKAKLAKNSAYTQLGMQVLSLGLAGGVGKGGGAAASGPKTDVMAGTQGSNIPRPDSGSMIA